MYNAGDPWMSVDDGQGRLVGRHCRPSPSPSYLKKTAPFLSCPWTTATLPSVPVRSDPGRTGRLTSLFSKYEA